MDTVISLLTGLSDSQVRAFRHTSTLAGQFCCRFFMPMLLLPWQLTCTCLNVVVSASHEADDSLGECRSEPEYQYGQHTKTVRGREEQGHCEEGQR